MPAPGGVEEGTDPGPVAMRRGPGGRRLAGRNDRGRPGHVRAQRGPLARQAKAPRSSCLDDAGEAQLLQLVQSPPPDGQARWTLRALARKRVARGIVSRIRYETVRRVLKNELTICRRVQRCYSPVLEADFVIPRERVLDLYSQPYETRYPVSCRDEQPKLLRADERPPQPARPGRPAAYDYAYARCGPCTIWIFVEPLGPWRTAHATARRRAWTGRAGCRLSRIIRATARPSA